MNRNYGEILTTDNAPSRDLLRNSIPVHNQNSLASQRAHSKTPKSKKMFSPIQKVILIITLTVLSIGKTFSQPIALDPTFGTNGVAEVQLNNGFGPQPGFSTILQPDKKILVAYCNSGPASRMNFVVARLNENGSMDLSFGVNGFFLIDLGPFTSVATFEAGQKIALQPDGKIVGVATAYNANSLFNEMLVIRLNSNGTLDNSFGVGGRAQIDIGDRNDDGSSVLVQQDGKIVVGGESHHGNSLRFAAARLLSNGQLDNSFDGDGKLALQLVTTFEIVYSVKQQADGKILLGGMTNSGNADMVVIRLNVNGSLDNTFYNGNGWRTIATSAQGDVLYDMAIQSDNKIVVAGNATFSPNTFFSAARLNPDGSLDNSFDNDGIRTLNFGFSGNAARTVDIQSDGKIILAGGAQTSTTTFGYAIARLNTDGSNDNSFDGDGRKTFEIEGHASDLVIQPDGKLLMVGAGSYVVNAIRTTPVDPVAPNCSVVNISGGQQQITISGLQIAPNVTIQVFNSAWATVFNQSYTNGPDQVQVSSLVGGQYFVKVSFFSSTWNPLCSKEAFVSITQPPTTPVISIETANTVTEKNGTVSALKVSLSHTASQPVSVEYTTTNATATAGSDYISKSGTLTIPAGSIGDSIFIDLIDDNVQESTEAFQITISNPVNAIIGNASGTVTILDNDQVGPNCNTVVISSDDNVLHLVGLTAPNTTVQVFNSSWNTIFNNSYAAPNTVDVPITIAGTYFVKITFYSSNWSQLCEKTAFITITSTQATVSINDANVNESAGNAQVQICVSSPAQQAVSISYTTRNGSAVDGSDYLATSGTAIIPAGQNCISIMVPIVNDVAPESTEHFRVVLLTTTFGIIGDSTSQVTIVDDDACPPGAICVSNSCDQPTVNLNSAYSVNNLPPGAEVTWHSGTPATDVNRLTSTQAQNISQSGIYYAAVKIANCYSGTISVVVTINNCAQGSTVKKSADAPIETLPNRAVILPNPFTHFLKIGIKADKNEIATVELMNAMGQKVFSKVVHLQAGYNDISLSGLQKVPLGPLFLRIVSKEKIEVFKLIKQQ